MGHVTCKGMPAFWINGWLAAVGATVLDVRIRLHWTVTDNLAVLSATGCDPVDVLIGSWPDEKMLSELPIASDWKGAGKLERKVNVTSFQQRARAARTHLHSWTLSSTMTDLSVDKNGEVAHAPFDPPGPGTVKWMHHRLSQVHRHVSEPSAKRILDSLAGEARRVRDNGLGFDQARIGSQADETEPWTDPVAEVMAFFGLALLPMRGPGVDSRLQRNASGVGIGRQRGWWKPPGHRSAHRFQWPAWGQPLDRDGIDALLDAWSPGKMSQWPTLGVHAGWRSAAFKPNSASDPTRAYGAERL